MGNETSFAFILFIPVSSKKYCLLYPHPQSHCSPLHFAFYPRICSHSSYTNIGSDKHASMFTSD